MCCTRLAEIQECKHSLPAHDRRILSGYIFATKAFIDNQKKILSSNISSTCPHNMVKIDPLKTKIGWRVWGTPENFKGFRLLASLLHRRRPTVVNQTLRDVWPSPGLVQYIHFRGSFPATEFCQVQNSLCVQVLRSHILAALLHDTLRFTHVLSASAAAVSNTYIPRGVHHFVLPCRSSFFARPFVKRFVLCHRTVVLSVCLSCLQRLCTVAKQVDGSR